MKLRNLSLYALLATLYIASAQAEESNPFAPKNIEDHAIALAKAEPLTVDPSIASSSHEEEPANPFAPVKPTNLEDHATPSEEHHAIALAPESSDEPENPFAHHESKNLEDHTMAPEDHHITANTEHSMPVEHASSSISKEHRSTAHQTASIKTLHITPGHSAILEPITITHGIEAERYFIQDKKYESYLSDHLENGPHGYPTERNYSVTIPATVHVGSFTVFKVQGMRGIPDHLEPAYHVEIQGTPHEIPNGTQYPEPQPSTFEKLNQLEEKYLTGVQTQFKAFTQEVRELITTAHNGEGAAPIIQKIVTKEPLTLMINESHQVTSFTGGSAQSSDPAIVSAALKFNGTKTAPQWNLILTGHKAGDAIITYSTGSESHLQPIVVIEKIAPKKPLTPSEEDSIKEKDALIHHPFTTHDDKEESQKNDTYSSTGATKPTEAIDEKEGDEIAHEDEPFASFLKESLPANADVADTENEAESLSFQEEEPSQHLLQADEEEPMEHQEVEK